MFRSNPVRRTIITSIGVLLLLNFLHGHLAFRSSVDRQATQLPVDSQVGLPPANLLRSAFLGFDTLATDLAWIWSLAYYGEHRSDAVRPKFLEHNAKTIADLDPYFFEVYEWFSASYIRSRHPPTHEDIEKVNAFLERGMEYFPTNYHLPYDAGLNYVGYARFRTDRQRIDELTSAIRYLQRASRLEGAPDILPLTVAWMYQRRRQIRAKLKGESASRQRPGMSTQQIEFLADVYFLLEDKGVRRSIESMLNESEQGRRILSSRGKSYAQRLEEERLSRFSYLPIGLWTAVAMN